MQTFCKTPSLFFFHHKISMSQCHCLSISLLSLFTAHMYFLRNSRPGQWRNGKAGRIGTCDLTQIPLVFSLFFELFRNYHTVFNHASFCMVNAWNRLIPINRRNKENKWSRDQVPGIAKYGKKNKLFFFKVSFSLSSSCPSCSFFNTSVAKKNDASRLWKKQFQFWSLRTECWS